MSSSASFITLTYDTKTVPITSKGWMTLRKRDWQLFMKRLRKLETNKLKYYAVGEYGDKNKRPHFHAILFNVSDNDNIQKAWEQGEIHIGAVSGASIAYTTKYIDKEKRIPEHKNDDRQREFSLMSKGLGANYLTPAMTKYHQADITRMYVDKEGTKLAMPRYYRDKIYTEAQKKAQKNYIVNTVIPEKEADIELYIKTYLNGTNITVQDYIDRERHARYKSFYNNQKVRK